MRDKVSMSQIFHKVLYVITQNIHTQSFFAEFIGAGKMFVKQGKLILFGLMAFFISVAVGNSIHYKDCPNVDLHAKLASVDVTPCPVEPCHFHKGIEANCTITLTPEADVTSGKLEVYGIIKRLKVPFPLPQPDACQDHNLACPLKGGAESKLKISLPVKKIYPSWQLIVQFGMKDQDDKYLFCIQFSVKIVG